MRNLYEGAPRQNYEDVFRSIGALLDQRGMREITLNETDDGFIIQGLTLAADEERPWNDPAAQLEEQQFVVRLPMQTRAGLRHMLVEFTPDETGAMIAAGVGTRGR